MKTIYSFQSNKMGISIEIEPEGGTETAKEYWADEAIIEFEIIHRFSNICDQRTDNLSKMKQFRMWYKKLLKKYKIPFKMLDNNKKNLTSLFWKRFKRTGLDQILNKCFERYKDDHDLIFFAAAKLAIDKLREMQDINTYIHLTRNTDSVLVFVIKYARIDDEHFVECCKFLIDNGIDINKFDLNGKTAIDYIAEYFQESAEENLRKVARLLVAQGECVMVEDTTNILKKMFEHENIDIKPISVTSPVLQAFYCIIQADEKKFCELFANKIRNADNDEHTLLQFAIKKDSNKIDKRSNKIHEIIRYLLKNGADPNRTTLRDKRTPLELALVNNDIKMFKELLKHSKTKVELHQYNNIVDNVLVNPSIPVRTEMFELLLQWPKLDVSMIHYKTGNTPLHFSLFFSNENAVKILLKQGSSVVTENTSGKSVLDVISPSEMAEHFDSCLTWKTHRSNMTDMYYTVKLNLFHSLIEKKYFDELSVVSKIAESDSLKHLLKHPLVYAFLSLKWSKTKKNVWLILFIQALIFLLLGFFTYRDFLIGELLVGFFNAAIKLRFFLIFKLNPREEMFPILKSATLHASVEILLVVTFLLGLFIKQIRAFLFIEMAICFLLTAGYHPKLSKWSLMLQKVFKTFSVLLSFFSLIIVAFAVGFYILFKDDGDELFKNFSTTMFKTYIMISGEMNLDDIEFKTSGSSGYLLLVIFALCVSLIIVNFWVATAVTDVAKIEENAEIKAIINIITFMRFIDHLYDIVNTYECKEFHHTNRFGFIFKKILNSITLNPYLFICVDDNNKKYYDVNKCKVVCHINNKDTFNEKSNNTELNKSSLNRIKMHVMRRKESENMKKREVELMKNCMREFLAMEKRNNKENKSDD